MLTTENSLRDAVKRALDASVPYVAQYGAILIPSENWSELAALINPAVARLQALMEKRGRGETLTEEDIQEALQENVSGNPAPDSLQATIVNILEAKPDWSITLDSFDSHTMRIKMTGKSHATVRAISWTALDRDQHEILLRTDLKFMERQLEAAEPPAQSID